MTNKFFFVFYISTYLAWFNFQGDIIMSESKITPVGIGAAIIAGGAAGVLAKQGYDKTVKVFKAAKPDTFMGKTASKASDIKSFFVKYLGKDAFKKYGHYIAEKFSVSKNYVFKKVSEGYHSNAMKKTGAFLKHPATLGAIAGVALYIGAKKFFGDKYDEFID